MVPHSRYSAEACVEVRLPRSQYRVLKIESQANAENLFSALRQGLDAAFFIAQVAPAVRRASALVGISKRPTNNRERCRRVI